MDIKHAQGFFLVTGGGSLALASPALAQTYGDSNGFGYDRGHREVHRELRHKRDDLYHELRDARGAAHAQAIDRWKQAPLFQEFRAELRYQDHARLNIVASNIFGPQQYRRY